MSTRSIIARSTGHLTFSGRYHHSDGYPSGLGKTLYSLYNGHFKKNLDKMLKVLLDDHQAGWSTINSRNFKKKCGYVPTKKAYTPTGEIKDDRPMCYCHGGRSDEPQEWTEKSIDSNIVYAYVFNSGEYDYMTVYYNYAGQFWLPIGTVNLDGPEPNWEKIEKSAKNSRSLLKRLVEQVGIIAPLTR